MPDVRHALAPGVALRTLLAVTYTVLAEGRTDEQRYELDVSLGLVESEFEQRTAETVPTSTADPVAVSLLAAYGETG